jgi:TPR repeat protein
MLTYGAEQNHVEAMFWLGLLYYNNEHSEEASSTADYSQAYKWWTAAAELGCLQA